MAKVQVNLLVGWFFCLLLKRVHSWCVEEDNKNHCFFNIRSKSPEDKLRAIRFIDAEENPKATIGSRNGALEVFLEGDAVPGSQVLSLIKGKEENLLVGIGNPSPQYVLDALSKEGASILQLNGNGLHIEGKSVSKIWKTKGSIPSAVLLSDIISKGKWYIAHRSGPKKQLEIGFQKNANEEAQGILSVSADAPKNSISVMEDGSLHVVRLANNKLTPVEISLRKARGIPDSDNPKIIANGDQIGKVSFQGYDGDKYEDLFSLLVTSDGGAVSTKKLGGKLSILGRSYITNQMNEFISLDGNSNVEITASTFLIKSKGNEMKISNGQTDIYSTVHISKTLDVAEGLNVGEDLQVNGSLTVHGIIRLGKGSLELTNERLKLNCKLQNSGGIETKDDVYIGGSLHVDSSAVFHETVTSEKDTNVKANLVVGGEANVGSNFTIQSGDIEVKQGSINIVEGMLLVGPETFVVNNKENLVSTQGMFLAENDVQIAGKATLKNGLSIASGGILVVDDAQVSGSLYTTGSISTTSEQESESPGSGSITTLGGVGVAKSVHIGEDITVKGKLKSSGILIQSASSQGSLSMLEIDPANNSIFMGTNLTVNGNLDMSGHRLSNVTIHEAAILGVNRFEARSNFVVEQGVIETSGRNQMASTVPLDTRQTHEKLVQLQGVTYTLKGQDSQGPSIGLIAEDIEELFPEVVSNLHGFSSGEDAIGIKYSRLVPALIESVKHLNERVSALETLIKEYKTTCS